MDTFFDDWPFYSQVALVLFFLALSGFFSMVETSMLSSNRHRLRAMANSGNAGAALAERLLKRIDSLLSVLLISNNLINTILPILVTGIALHVFGNSGFVLSIATLVVALLIIIFSEITPKVIGAAFPEKIASNVGWLILPLTFALKPLLWFSNSFVSGLMKVSGLQSSSDSRAMSKEELRSLVLESNRFVSNHHRNILLNLFNLENIIVDDVMTPRSKIEVLDLSRPIDEVVQQLETCYHNKLPVSDGDSDHIIGILSVKKALSLLGDTDLKHEDFRALLNEPYFIPSGPPVLQQMQFFQDNQQRLSLVVNEYGEVLGLVTFEDIVEELIGEFTTSFSNLSTDPRWLNDGTYLATGGASLQDLNRLLNLNLPLDGPRTLNGLILEKLEAIPDHNVSIRIAGIIMEIVQFDEHGVKTVKLYRPTTLAQDQDCATLMMTHSLFGPGMKLLFMPSMLERVIFILRLVLRPSSPHTGGWPSAKNTVALPHCSTRSTHYTNPGSCTFRYCRKASSPRWTLNIGHDFSKPNIDCRVSILPTLYGEKAVIRILPNCVDALNLKETGLLSYQLEIFQKALSRSNGLILVTGPTGSGKTRTLYSCLRQLNQEHRNLCSIEDPIEIRLAGVNQVAYHPRAGLDFPIIIRALLRQDPDVIMIGEIRDAATAQLAIQAAQTGHLVLSTLHTRNARGAITRLKNLGIDREAIESCLLIVSSQRLVRRICHHCFKFNSEQRKICLVCNGAGYFGRIGIHEVLDKSHLSDPTIPAISMHEAGCAHIQAGVITPASLASEVSA